MRFIHIYFTITVSLATVSGCQQQDESSSAQDAQQNNTIITPKQQAYIDPETGELISRPTNLVEPKIASSRVKTDVKSKPLEVITSPDGTVTIKLDDRFNKQLTATDNCDGELQLKHQDKTDLTSKASKCAKPEEDEK